MCSPKSGMESLLLALPFVCKSWHAASLNPLCWEILHFPEFEPYPLFTTVDDTNVEPKSFGPFYNKFVEDYKMDRTRFSITGFVKLVVDRSKGKAVELKLPQFCTEEALRYAADGCPGIRYLHFTDDLVFFKHSQILPEVIGKWKLLEHLTLGGNMENIVRQFRVKGGAGAGCWIMYIRLGIGICMRFWCRLGFTASGCVLCMFLMAVWVRMRRWRLRQGCRILCFLTLEQCRIEGNTLVTLLQGCKKLWRFDLWNFEGFVMDDDEMLQLGSHVKEFRWTRAMTGYKRFHVLKMMIILTRAKQDQIWRKR